MLPHSAFLISLFVISPASKMVGGVTYILFTACFIAQEVNQTFILAIKTMILRDFLAEKLVNSSAIFMLLETWHLELPHPWHPTFFNRIQLRSHYVIFYFSCASVRYDRSRRENFWTSPSLYKKGNKSLTLGW